MNLFTTTIRQLRLLTPNYPLADYQARGIAERQATKLLELFDIRAAPVDVSLIAELPRLEVVVRSTAELGGLSGLSEWHKGRWQIAVNKDDSVTRRRFTLAHEFKHVLDHPFMRVLYTDRYGRTNEPRVEAICDYFAACLLMPRPWVKRTWATLTQDQTQLAAHFRVSPAAMGRRLIDLGLSEPHPRWHADSVARYFRTAPITRACA
jgi:Zn-dependent peptidase ImmA (M78 family)